MIKFSVTQIDSYLRYMRDEITEDMLISNLLRTGSGNLKMSLGTLFHSLLEDHSKTSEIFDMDQINQYRYLTKFGVNEERAKIKFNTSRGFVTISGIADNIAGNVVNEFKTTWSAFNIDNYITSVQWQMYALMFGARAVRYSVFEFYLSTTISDMSDIKEPLRFRDFHQFTMHTDEIDLPYLKTAISGLTDFIYAKGLDANLKYEYDTSQIEIFSEV